MSYLYPFLEVYPSRVCGWWKSSVTGTAHGFVWEERLPRFAERLKVREREKWDWNRDFKYKSEKSYLNTKMPML